MFPAPDPSAHPVDVGLRSEAAVLAALCARGYRVLVPFGFNNRYDLVIEHEGRFVRVQCKTGRLRDGVVAFSTRSVRCSTSGVFTRDYEGEVDAFVVYCPQNQKIYVVPQEEAARGSCSLRVEPAVNGQSKGIRWARDYELPG